MTSAIPPEECYEHMGFSRFEGDGSYILSKDWQRLQDSQVLLEIRQRYEWQRDCAGQPLVDHGFVVGWVPELRLGASELARLLAGLQEGIEAGCVTVGEWQERRSSKH